MTRDEAINWIINLTADIGKMEHQDLWHYEQALEEIRDMIEAMPLEQPERIKGRWIKISPAGIYECSVCGQNVMTDDIDVYYYCHGCGADMRERDEQKSDDGI